MRIVDCPWEIENLGCHVAEVFIDKDETFGIQELQELERKYDYIVIKTPTGNYSTNMALANHGYYLAETQITIEKKSKDFILESRLERSIYDKIHVEIIQDNNELEHLISKITPDMFCTDRIYLDPEFGPEYSRRRYVNWIRQEFNRGTAIEKFYYSNEEIGFNFNRYLEDGTADGLLGGIFRNSKTIGIGLALPLGVMWSKNNIKDFKKFVGHISSNNLSVIKVYNYLHYEQTNFTNVFVKHV